MESDRVSLLDFDIEEKEELSPEPVERKTSEEKVSKQARDTSFFANLLGAAADTSSGKNVENFLNTSQKDNGPWKSPQVDNPQDFSLSQILSSTSLNESGKKDSKVKKFTKLSQKERKRLEEEKAKTGETVPVSPAGKSWTGWSPASTPSNQPSLMDIMLSQANNGHIDKSPETRQSDGKKQQPTKDRRLSEDESGSKTTKRKTWKQLEIGASPEKSLSGASPSPPLTGNPWKLSTSASSPALAAASQSNIVEEQNRSFLEIMEQDVKEEETVIRAVNKPLHMLQLEEQAMLELHQLYSLQYPDEVITVARVEQPIVSAKPVWKYKL